MKGNIKGNKKEATKEQPKLLDKVNSPFDCSGTIELKEPATLFYST